MPKPRTAQTGEPAFSHRQNTLGNSYLDSGANPQEAAISHSLCFARLTWFKFNVMDSG